MLYVVPALRLNNMTVEFLMTDSFMSLCFMTHPFLFYEHPTVILFKLIKIDKKYIIGQTTFLFS